MFEADALPSVDRSASCSGRTVISSPPLALADLRTDSARSPTYRLTRRDSEYPAHTVGTQEAERLADRNGKVDPPRRVQPAVALVQPPDFDRRTRRRAFDRLLMLIDCTIIALMLRQLPLLQYGVGITRWPNPLVV